MKPWSLVETYQRLRRTYCVQVQDRSALVYHSQKVLRWLIRRLNKHYLYLFTASATDHKAHHTCS